MVFSDFSRLSSKAGHFSIALSKGAKTTTWIWNLHADAHDFDIQQSVYYSMATALITRKVFSSNLAHLSLVFFWISRMHFDGAYFANDDIWKKDPKHYLGSAHLVSSLIGQDILNSDIGNYFQGIHINAGIFQLWRCQGIITQIHLKYGSSASLIGTIICITGSYPAMHPSPNATLTLGANDSLSPSQMGSAKISHLLGVASLAWSSHQIHISSPANRLLDSGIDPVVIPSLQDLFIEGVFIHPRETFRILSGHHFYVATTLIGASDAPPIIMHNWAPKQHVSIHLLFAASNSSPFAHHIPAIPIYPYIASDYPPGLSLFYHQINIATFLIIGTTAHTCIFAITTINGIKALNHRHWMIAHLIYFCFALGLHSFSLYIHNDTLQPYLRGEDMFSDNSIQLKPVFAIHADLTLDIKMLDKKVIAISQELGTADFIVDHIHAFTIHIALLILSKGILYARNSRLVSDKSPLGFRYPCDGPGRGGTCQISPYDHLYLAIFWMYNSLSVVLFHYFWKMQSDLWGILNMPTRSFHHICPAAHHLLTHPSTSDFSVNSTTINGWLRNLLWGQAGQVIQSYGTSISTYGLIFICTHFIWAFSLMFLYSGRGYWQELIESILWAHHKLKIINLVQPRALSISQGRAVGLIHYTLGGVGCTWAFVISRMVVLS